MKKLLLPLLALALRPDPASAQAAKLWPAPSLSLPAAIVDGNSPSVWIDGKLQVYTSTGSLLAMRGESFEDLASVSPPQVETTHLPIWIEAIWKDEDGTIYAWYHHEPGGLCGGKLTAPEIGALVSDDGGQTFRDLGIVLSSGDPLNCDAPNGFFAGGHGDFSVVLDRDRQYFYFLFTNYGGSAATHGISVARMPFGRRADPIGAVSKYFEGDWKEAGVSGRVTPVLPATTGWDQTKTDSFWGPAVHWNTFLQNYVVLLNRACCDPGWPQEGIYVFFAANLAEPPMDGAPETARRRRCRFFPSLLPSGGGHSTGRDRHSRRRVSHGFS